MKELAIFQVDAFSDEVFRGNPAAVVPLDEWLPPGVMQAIGAENNLSETAFFVTHNGGYHLRWFTPTVEVDLCGHATLASAHVLFTHLGFERERVEFHTRSGRLDVEKKGEEYVMDFPTDRLTAAEAPPALLEGLRQVPSEVYTGREDYLVVFETQSDVATLGPDFVRLKELDGRGVIATAPGDIVDFVSRGFFPNAGIDEDPVTGSAHTTLTPYWAERLNKDELTARQISTRGGSVRCKLKGERVELAGRAVTYLTGTIFLASY
jgi:PhzF family phenazine biosynthesis protein